MHDPKELNSGAAVNVSLYRSKSTQGGLTYSSFTGTLVDDAGTSRGWDVVDVLNHANNEVISVYCFSLSEVPSFIDSE